MEPSDLPTPNPPKDLKSKASGHKVTMPSIQFPYGLKNSVAAYQEFLAEKLSSYYQEAPLFGKHEGLVISSTPWGESCTLSGEDTSPLEQPSDRAGALMHRCSHRPASLPTRLLARFDAPSYIKHQKLFSLPRSHGHHPRPDF